MPISCMNVIIIEDRTRFYQIIKQLSPLRVVINYHKLIIVKTYRKT